MENKPLSKQKDAIKWQVNDILKDTIEDKRVKKMFLTEEEFKNFKDYESDELRKPESEREKELRKRELTIFLNRIVQAEEFIKSYPFFYDKNRLWWVWNFERFCYEITDEIDLLNRFGDTDQSVDTIQAKIRTEIINACKQVGRRNIPEPIKKTWIQFKDIIIDFEDGSRFEANPKYFVTNPIPIELSENKETPTIDKIFKEWVGEKYVQTLYEIIAYCLIPDYPLHRLFCFIGSGMNGKSKFLELLRTFIGSENVTATELDTLITSRFEITRLHKKLVAQMGETNFNELSKTSIIKKLTGQDTIGFEYKNKNPFEDYNYAKILIATNNLPTTTDKTVGFYRRWLIIDFPNHFSEKRDILKDIPEEEYNALAAKSVIILKGLLEKREFHNEGNIEQRKKRYEDRSDFLQTFLEEFTEQQFGDRITKHDFKIKFESWCKEKGHRFMSDVVLGKKMKIREIESIRQHFDWLNDGKGGRIWVWDGLKWKD